MYRKMVTIVADRETVELSAASILYADLNGRKTVLHLPGGKRYETYTPLDRLEQELGGGFLRVSRDCLVSASAIHRTHTAGIELVNGETLTCTRRRKRTLREVGRTGRRDMLAGLDRSGMPSTQEEYQQHYAAFDALPIAFTDIEMVFNEEHFATDWRFRYVNPALAKLEKLPKEKLLENSFRTLFPNMDDKWLCAYERTALYGETLEIMDYSLEIDTYLKIICFPTFRGHCGCLLFDLSQIQLARTSTVGERTAEMYLNGFSIPAPQQPKRRQRRKKSETANDTEREQ